METREGLTSGVTVIGAEAPSTYHVAPRTENPSQMGLTGAVSPVSVGLAGAVSTVSVGLTGTTEKKKRGRPRKYGPDDAVARALSPIPISSSAPPGEAFSGGKPSKVWPGSFEKKKYKKVGMENSGMFPFSSHFSNSNLRMFWLGF